MGTRPRPWSDDKKAEFLRLAQEGKSARQIAGAMGISETSTSAAARRYGVKLAIVRPVTSHAPEIVDKVMVEMIAGKSAAMVAAMINKTRNVVIGIWHRNATTAQRMLHAARQKRPTRRPVSTFNRPRRSTTAALDAPPPTPRASAPTAQPADTVHTSAIFDGVALVPSVLKLEPHHCRWPAGKGYCGHAHKVGSPYCDRHHARAYAQASASHTPNAIARITDESRGIISR